MISGVNGISEIMRDQEWILGFRFEYRVDGYAFKYRR